MRYVILFLAHLLLGGCAIAQSSTEISWSPRQALERFATDYENDPSAIAPLSFGVAVGDENYSVYITPDDDGLAAEVTEGFVGDPTFFFKTDYETLAQIDTGALHGLTAMAQTRANDPAPMTLEFMDGFKPQDQTAFQSRFLSVAFHFWTRELPERIRLEESASRVVHGANAVAVFYDPELHSAWYHVKKGQHVNADPKDQTNDHPSLFIFTNGHGQARIDGVEQTVRANEVLHVPRGVAHEFWNPHDTPLEFIILMWGFGN